MSNLPDGITESDLPGWHDIDCPMCSGEGVDDDGAECSLCDGTGVCDSRDYESQREREYEEDDWDYGDCDTW